MLAESYERIHRANLVGMGILPLELPDGETVESLGLSGHETFEVTGLEDAGADGFPREVTVRADDKELTCRLRIDTPNEVEYYRHGGILQYVLRQLRGRSWPRWGAGGLASRGHGRHGPGDLPAAGRGGQEGLVAPVAESIPRPLRGMVPGEPATPRSASSCSDDPASGHYHLWRLLVDAGHQGKGYGRRAVELAYDYVRASRARPSLLTSWVPGERGPEEFYASGFEHRRGRGRRGGRPPAARLGRAGQPVRTPGGRPAAPG